MRTVQVFPFDPFDVVGAFTQIMADPIIDRIASNGRNNQQDDEQPYIHITDWSKRTCREQQRVPRQKWCDDKTCLHKDNEEKNCVRPDTVLINNICQMLIKMQEEVDQKSNLFHYSLPVHRALD